MHAADDRGAGRHPDEDAGPSRPSAGAWSRDVRAPSRRDVACIAAERAWLNPSPHPRSGRRRCSAGGTGRRSTVGIAVSSVPAQKMPKLLLRSPATRPNMPTASVLASASVRKTLAIRNSLMVPMKASSAGDREDRRDQRQDDPEEDLRVRGTVHRGRLVQLPGHGVEEALHQPGVHAQRAAEVEQDQAPGRVEADRRVELGDRGEHQEDRHDRQELREHLDQQQRQQPDPAAAEPHPAEGVRGQRRQEHRRRPRRAPAISTELTNQRANAVSREQVRRSCPATRRSGSARSSDSVPSGLSAAESTNTIGKSANSDREQRRPRAASRPGRAIVMSTPPPAAGCAGS